MPGYTAAASRTPVQKMLYRVEEAAEAMSLSRTAVFGLIKSGELETIKVGGRRRIPHAAIVEYITQQLTAEAADTAEAVLANQGQG